jgi:hypothetical protein
VTRPVHARAGTADAWGNASRSRSPARGASDPGAEPVNGVGRSALPDVRALACLLLATPGPRRRGWSARFRAPGLASRVLLSRGPCRTPSPRISFRRRRTTSSGLLHCWSSSRRSDRAPRHHSAVSGCPAIGSAKKLDSSQRCGIYQESAGLGSHVRQWTGASPSRDATSSLHGHGRGSSRRRAARYPTFSDVL